MHGFHLEVAENYKLYKFFSFSKKKMTRSIVISRREIQDDMLISKELATWHIVNKFKSAIKEGLLPKKYNMDDADFPGDNNGNIESITFRMDYQNNTKTNIFGEVTESDLLNLVDFAHEIITWF